MLLIADLSNNNGAVDFGRLAQVPGLKGVMLKASEGHTFTDRTFAGFRRDANRHGLRVGAYHFAKFGAANVEAALFAAIVGTVGPDDLRPALDAEDGSGAGKEAWMREWSQAVRERLHVGPLVYSYPAWLVELHASRPIGYGLWLASFGRNDGVEHPYVVPAPWKRAVMHQFTSNARLPGVQGGCDLSSAASLRPLLAHPAAGAV